LSSAAFAAVVVLVVVLVGLASSVTPSSPAGTSSEQTTQSTSAIYYTTESGSTSSESSRAIVSGYLIHATTFSNGTVKSVTVSLTVSSTDSTGSDPCAIGGPPNGMFVEVVSDSGNIVVGAQVNASLDAGGDDCNGVYYPGSNTTKTFTSTGGWTGLPLGEYGGSYSFKVEYQGHYYSYDISAETEPLSTTCVTLSVPSARSDVSQRYLQTSCS
jgi:hypothetical protein